MIGAHHSFVELKCGGVIPFDKPIVKNEEIPSIGSTALDTHHRPDKGVTGRSFETTHANVRPSGIAAVSVMDFENVKREPVWKGLMSWMYTSTQDIIILPFSCFLPAIKTRCVSGSSFVTIAILYHFDRAGVHDFGLRKGRKILFRFMANFQTVLFVAVTIPDRGGIKWRYIGGPANRYLTDTPYSSQGYECRFEKSGAPRILRTVVR